MTPLAAAALVIDASFVLLLAYRLNLSRRRGVSLRLRIFVALAIAALCGALATGIYAVLVDAYDVGLKARLLGLLPKALILVSVLLPLAAAGAMIVGRRLARPVEELTEAATRIAEGERRARLPQGEGSETRRLARALASMRRELEGKPYAAAFLRDAWHDLKTPVAALRATLEILDDEALADPATARHFVGNMRRSTEQLERTLHDLVTLARFETATVVADETVAMASMIAGAVSHIEPLAEAKDVRVRVSSPGDSSRRIRCDAVAIERAIGNLLENAVHASPGGGVVRVTVSHPDKSAVAVDIENEPSSVPMEVRARLFERGHSGGGKGRAGSGLGLAIVRAAVEAHGGTVRFTELGPPRVVVRIELPG